ncbi:MAG: hypothetical protein IT562_24285 [Alphaproteobacteria bacterium]|nr:hypothetical protein [Alphaproteobacteria bacterium]
MIRIRDHGDELAIGFEDCVKYHGRTSIGGVALGYRLLERAFRDLCVDAVPEREKVSVLTAFPGPGLRDALEMVARVVTREAYRCDPACAPPNAPDAVVGRLYFEIAYDGRRARYVPPPGAMSAEFIRLGRMTKSGQASAADAARWTELKEELALTVMAAPLDRLFTAC